MQTCSIVNHTHPLFIYAGTSSRSTKLIHGGIRYLEKAFTHFDRAQFTLVTEALAERQHLLHISPHLSRPLPIIVPFYQPFPQSMFYLPYYYAGVKAYDIFAGSGWSIRHVPSPV